MAFEHGAVVRLYTKDFMRFKEFEMRPGPNLNLVLAPNGCGKSSIVVALALGLGAKPATLGRADQLSDFIRLGAEVAITEIELFNAQGDRSNFVVRRQWDQQNHSKWYLNGKVSKLKEVKEMAKELNIQTENLCQFLPQDKVHDFSKMDPKLLLIRTMEVIAKPDLENTLNRMKDMVKGWSYKKDGLESKSTSLKGVRQRLEEITPLVRSCEEKCQLEERLKLLKKKYEWALTADLKHKASAQKELLDTLVKEVNEKMRKLEPVKNRLLKSNSTVQELISQCKGQVADIELAGRKVDEQRHKLLELDREIDRWDEKLSDITCKEAKWNEALAAYDKDIANLKMTIEESSLESQEVERVHKSLCSELNALCQGKEETIQLLQSKIYEQKNLFSTLVRMKDSLTELQNVEKRKLELLKRNFLLGRDACRALEWLNENRHQFSSPVYPPLILHMNVKAPQENGIYVENTISTRDLIAFGASNSADANKLMHQFRDVMKLRVNVVTLNATPDVKKYQMLVDPSNFDTQLGFRGCLKDVIDAPEAVMDFLCQHYMLHKLLVFDKGADRHVDTLVERVKLMHFFIGSYVHKCTVSKYSGHTSVMSQSLRPKRWFELDADPTRLKDLKAKIDSLEGELEVLESSIEQHRLHLKGIDRQIEEKKNKVKEASDKLNHRKVLLGKLQAKEVLRRDHLKSKIIPDDVEQAKRNCGEGKRKIVTQKLNRVLQLPELLRIYQDREMKHELIKLRLRLSKSEGEALRLFYHESNDKLDDIRSKIGEEKENYNVLKRKYVNQLSIAQTTSSEKSQGGQPPGDLLQQFQQAGINELSLVEIRAKIAAIEGDLECLDNVDQEILSEYKNLNRLATEMEQELLLGQKQNDEDWSVIHNLRESWLTQIGEIMSEISSQFSKLMSTLGFGGEVVLNASGGDDQADKANPFDFERYGINIMVKFRGNVPMAALNPFSQSGGERSVATCLYMLALQSLSKVPFRCADEINQGMDERNERLVFDLLVQTSFFGKGSQYFLLTPKLLPNLEYKHGINVILIYAGSGIQRVFEQAKREALLKKED